ncbi:hypothetical protein NQ318_007885, partial [Aromia moschata]
NSTSTEKVTHETMKCTIPEISWHNREPVLSVDINPLSNNFYKLATGGGDSHVLIWQISITDNGAIKQDVIADLTRHQKAVNVVRWSPNGQYLASADDNANIIVWQQKTDNIPLLEGSIDNTAILWDFTKGKLEHILSDHKGFVQGVAWDPKDQVIATISTDRVCRIFDTSGKHVKARISKGQLPVSSTHYLYEKNVKYFHDDTFKSFFRMLQFSPDGSLLIIPSGHMESEDCKKILNGTLVFTLDNNWSKPAAILPIRKQCSTVVRCCPILFRLREEGSQPVLNLPYRMIIAVGADHDVILYDTQQLIPFARFQEVHYTRLTDLTWSNDGLILVASSTDGFCTLITFDADELGIPYVKEDSEVKDNLMDVSGCEELGNTDENIDTSNKDNKEGKAKQKSASESKKRSFLEEWALKTPKKLKPKHEKKRISSVADENIIEIIDDNGDSVELAKNIQEDINRPIPTAQTVMNIVHKYDSSGYLNSCRKCNSEGDNEGRQINEEHKVRDIRVCSINGDPDLAGKFLPRHEHERAHNLNELRTKIVALQSITPDMLTNMRKEFFDHLGYCLAQQDGIFEPGCSNEMNHKFLKAKPIEVRPPRKHSDEDNNPTELSKEIKEQISQLLPTKISQKSKTNVDKIDNRVANPIPIRRKPKPADEEKILCDSNSETESLEAKLTNVGKKCRQNDEDDNVKELTPAKMLKTETNTNKTDDRVANAARGGDSHVLIWQISITDNGAIKQEVIADLTRHQKAVNVVRWSPNGQYLASADDDANIIVWQQKTDNIPLLEGDTGDKEIWTTYKVLRGHKEDIYDLCWSVSGLKLFTGSIDNTAILWDFTKGKLEHILSDHKGFVQGVAWDPKDQVIATISTDRVCRIFDTSGKHVKARISKGQLPVSSTHYLYEKNVKYFHDDTFKSFFRRLQFSPDGSLLIVPSGHMESEDCKKILNGTLVFTLDNNWSKPAAILPIRKQCSTVVRCCPILFRLREEGSQPVLNLPYRMIIAVGADHDVILYDTQQLIPFARFQEVHYTRLTDLTWSNDGLILVASSTDGFCTLITFDADELGIPYVKEDSEVEDNLMDVSGCEELGDTDENIDTSNKDNKEGKAKQKSALESKKRSFLEEWAVKTPKKLKLEHEKKRISSVADENIIEIIDDNGDSVELAKNIQEDISKSTPTKMTPNADKVNTIARPIAVKRKPKEVDEKKIQSGSSSDTKTKSSEAKPIEVRRKPRTQTTQDDPRELSTSIKEEISQLVPTKTSQKTETNTDKADIRTAKPISVRRKPKEADEERVRPEPSSDTKHEILEARPINVRKKQSDEDDNPRELSKKITEEVSQLFPTKMSQKIEANADKTDDRIAKPIAVRRKPKEEDKEKVQPGCSSEMNHKFLKAKPIEVRPPRKHSDEDDNPSELSKEIKEKINKLLPTKMSQKNETNVDKIDKRVANPIPIRRKPKPADEEKNPIFKKGTPKVKVSSLTKKKSSTNPSCRTNSLLNFLKNPEVKSKNSNKTKSLLSLSGNIDLTLGEDEARDAWKCEKDDKEDRERKQQSIGEANESRTEDCTEDFCLQLEDTEPERDINVSGEAEKNRKEKEDTVSVSRTKDTPDIISISDDSSDADRVSKGKNPVQQKIPHRVPLITLSSPKGKKKGKP